MHTEQKTFVMCSGLFDIALMLFWSRHAATLKILNDQIRTIASRHSVIIANAHLLFGDLAVALTHVLLGDIHPNNAGYGVVLRAFQDAYEEVGPFSGGATP